MPDGDAVYVLANDGTLWRKAGNAGPEEVDKAVAAFQEITRMAI